MSNPYFKFKRFTVFHERCAMKVGTDGVLLGAWADLSGSRSVLDIGAGCGLISLMSAQRFSCIEIDSIEIDSEAAEQANQNYINSPFYNISPCENISLQNYVEMCDKKYDKIVSNPPFFSHSLLSPDRKRTTARHTDSLPIEDLIALSVRLLSEKGRISLIFPASEKQNLQTLAAENKLWVSRLTEVFPVPGAEAKRILVELSNERVETEYAEIVIEIERHVYSPEFKELLKDFYLKF